MTRNFCIFVTRSLLATLLIIPFAGCSRGSQQPTATGTGTRSTQLQCAVGDECGTEAGTGDEFDLTGTGSRTTGTNSLSQLGDTSSLFDKPLSNEELGTTPTAPVTSSQVAQCTSQTGALYAGTDYGDDLRGSNYSSQTNQCFRNTKGYNLQTMLGYGSLNSWSLMDGCLQAALQHAPSPGSSQTTVSLAFVQAQIFIVRCFRLISQWQSNLLPWSGRIQQGFDYTDGMYGEYLRGFARRQ